MPLLTAPSPALPQQELLLSELTTSEEIPFFFLRVCVFVFEMGGEEEKKKTICNITSDERARPRWGWAPRTTAPAAIGPSPAPGPVLLSEPSPTTTPRAQDLGTTLIMAAHTPWDSCSLTSCLALRRLCFTSAE